MNSIPFKVTELFQIFFLGHDSPDIDQPSIGMLCYSCDSPKESSECQTSPNQTATTMCESKQQICYTKRTSNTAGKLAAAANCSRLYCVFIRRMFASVLGKLVQFSRGCSVPPATVTTGNLTQPSQCLSSKTEGKTVCVKYCQTSMCNTQDIR